jgi:hypothetical protein
MEENSSQSGIEPILGDETLAMCLASPHLSKTEKEEAFNISSRMAQILHDHYVALQRVGRLREEDYESYQLALEREANGDVMPLEPGGEIEIIKRLDAIDTRPPGYYQ